MPHLLSSLNEQEMKSMGMQLSAEDIYSINRSSLKDAVLQFGSGCTGELISPEGLLVTNHHCGFSQIQSLSTLEKNYLENGFWAKAKSEEIPCPGLTVTFIREIREVTEEVLAAVKETMDEDRRSAVIKSAVDSLEKKYTTKEFKAVIRTFYAGNKFYLYKTEVYSDIRLVGTPEESIGKFGGETDNWVWPRHTGDFSLFRIYAGKDNKPSAYATENVPYRPSHFLPVNISGVKEGDFVFVYGFPGRTNEYATSSAVQLVEEQTNPVRIAIRDLRLNIWREAMQHNDTIRLQYASKFSTVENAYKKWKGELLGFRRFHAVEDKRKEENSISNPVIRSLISEINDSIYKIRSLSLANDVYTEAFAAMEVNPFALKFKDLIRFLEADQPDRSAIEAEVSKLKKEAKGFYRNYNSGLDRKMISSMLQLIDSLLPDEFLPEAVIRIKGKENDFVDELFSKSSFVSEKELDKLMDSSEKTLLKKLRKDKLYVFATAVSVKQTAVLAEYNNQMKVINHLQRKYIASLLESAPELIRYPDANSTLRVSYGKVSGISPRDGVKYDHFTTANGIAEKNATGNSDFQVSRRLLELIDKKDYGRYGKNGRLNTAFISSLHTTGGNSGSPVLNAKGELVGINFDRIWEGVMSDYFFSEEICRNVALDTRYFLFIVDKLYGAGNLVQELKLIE